MYSSVASIPSEVKACLDDKDAQVWMEIYNSTFANAPKELSEKERAYMSSVSAWMGTRELPSAFSVVEWATVEDVDKDNEVVTLDKVEEHVDKYIEYGGMMSDTHTNLPLGHVWHSERAKHEKSGKEGLIVYYNLRGGTMETDKGRADWMNGKNHLSIGASATVDGIQCDSTRCWTKRGVRDLYEIALCEVPANPHADVIEAFPGRLNKGKGCGCDTKDKVITEPLLLTTLDRTVFLDADHCILQKVCKILRDVKTPHVTKIDGTHVIVKTDEDNEDKLTNDMDDAGLCYYYDLDKSHFVVKHKSDTYHRYRVECLCKGYVDRNWKLTDKMTQDMFSNLFNYDFVSKNGDKWELRRPHEIEKEGGAGGGGAGASGGASAGASSGATTGSTAGVSNASFGNISYRDIQQFKSNKKKEPITIKQVTMRG